MESIPDDDLQQVIVDYLIDHVIGEDFSKAESKVKRLSKGFQYVDALWVLTGEVRNGGFNQFFYNHRGGYIETAYEGARAVGADQMAEVIEGATLASATKMTSLAKAINDGTLQGFAKLYKEVDLSEWDQRFFQLHHELDDLVTAYIRKHPEEFVTK